MGQTSILHFINPKPVQQILDKQTTNESRKDALDLAVKPQDLKQEPQHLPTAPVSISAQISPTTAVVRTDIIIPDNLPQAAIVKIQPSHLPQLKNITAAIFPVKYSDKFFNECVSSAEVASISRSVLFDSKVVGLIRCRVEPFPSPHNPAYRQIYLQAIAILAPFRSLGLATRLLDYIVDIAAQLDPHPTCIYAHVWEANTDALEWYSRRGFTRVNLIPQYYHRLQPTGAWLVRRELG